MRLIRILILVPILSTYSLCQYVQGAFTPVNTGAVTFVRNSGTTCSSAFATTVTCAVTNAMQVNKRAVALFYSNVTTSGFLTSVTDPSNNTWSCVYNDIDQSSGFTLAVCDAIIATQINAGANITGHLANSSNGIGMIVYVGSTRSGSSGADTSGTSGGTVSSVSATTGAALAGTDFVFAAAIVRTAITVGALSTGYTALDTGLTSQNGYSYKIYTAWKTQSSGSTATVTATMSASDDAATTIAAYKQ